MPRRETNCLICFEENIKPIELKNCLCSFCQECFLKYAIVQISSISFEINKTLSCPNSDCKKELTIEEIRKNLDYQNLETLDSSLLTHYLQSSKDIRSCPIGTCNYYGILPKNRCDDVLTCEKCKFTWRDKENFTMKRKLINYFDNFLESHNESLNSFYEEVFTESCPNCGINISKNGGCMHMTCKKCTHEFCWICRQKYHGHVPVICFSHVLIKYSIFLIMIIGVLQKLNMVDLIISLSKLVFFNFLKYAIFFNSIIGFIFAIISLIMNFRKPFNRYKQKGYALMIFILAVLIIVFLITLYHYALFWDWLYFILFEIFAGAAIFGFISLCGFLWDNWMLYVY